MSSNLLNEAERQARKRIRKQTNARHALKMFQIRPRETQFHQLSLPVITYYAGSISREFSGPLRVIIRVRASTERVGEKVGACKKLGAQREIERTVSERQCGAREMHSLCKKKKKHTHRETRKRKKKSKK